MCIAIELHEAFDYAEKINIYNEGKLSVYQPENKPFDKILSEWKALIVDAHEMPAFGVSLNNETLKEMKKGIWTEFEFSRIYESNGMPFEKLLVSIKKGYSGFNIIRYNSKTGYDGRCFYYDLVDGNTDEFYGVLTDL